MYRDFEKPNDRRAHYLKEYLVNGVQRYTKVIVAIDQKPRFVVTAYRPDYVKERGKTELIYGKDN